MRWLKHLSQAAEDEKLAEVLDLHGAEGYGIYWLIVEKIAFLMDGSERTEARYSVKKWAKFCGKSPKVFRKFLESFEKLSLFNVEICKNNSDFLIIDCPNLLKYRDEYSKKSGQTPDKLPTDSGATPDQDRDRETETEDRETEKELLPHQDAEPETGPDYLTKKKRRLHGKRLDSFLMFWECFDYKKDKASAADSWLDIPKLTNAMVNEICEAAKIEAKNRHGLIENGQTPKFAQGWLTARRWEDEETTGPKKPDDTGKDAAKKSIERAQEYINS